MHQDQLSEEDIYDNVQFAPEKIIEQISLESPALGNTMMQSRKIDQLNSVSQLNPLFDFLEEQNEEMQESQQTLFMMINQ